MRVFPFLFSPSWKWTKILENSIDAVAWRFFFFLICHVNDDNELIHRLQRVAFQSNYFCAFYSLRFEIKRCSMHRTSRRCSMHRTRHCTQTGWNFQRNCKCIFLEVCLWQRIMLFNNILFAMKLRNRRLYHSKPTIKRWSVNGVGKRKNTIIPFHAIHVTVSSHTLTLFLLKRYNYQPHSIANIPIVLTFYHCHGYIKRSVFHLIENREISKVLRTQLSLCWASENNLSIDGLNSIQFKFHGCF